MLPHNCKKVSVSARGASCRHLSPLFSSERPELEPRASKKNYNSREDREFYRLKLWKGKRTRTKECGGILFAASKACSCDGKCTAGEPWRGGARGAREWTASAGASQRWNWGSMVKGGGCGSVGSVLDFESGGNKFESHCSQHVVVSLGKTLHPKLFLWGLSTELNVCKSLWIKASNKWHVM